MEKRAVTQALSIECEWSDPIGSPSEVAETTAFLDIRFGDRHATRAENEFSKTVTNRSLLSAYPFALWLAASWWRLRWETSPPYMPSNDWRMSHELPAAGGGFVWPKLVFESDGESIHLRMAPSKPSPFESLHYLEDLHGWVSAIDFEYAVTTFLNLVCARLDQRGLRNTQLQALWSELTAERSDPALARFRVIEAILGFDPGDASEDLVDRFLKLNAQAGPAASQEIAHAAAAGSEAERVLTEIVNSVSQTSATGKFQVHASPEIRSLRSAHPWKRGYALAQRIRETCGLGTRTLDDNALAGLLGLQESVLQDQVPPVSVPAGIAIRGAVRDRFLFRKRWRSGRRFEAARMLSDHLLAPDSDSWLLETDTRTARQQAQRAFAAEILCPIAELEEYLKGDFSETRIEEAADHFVVSDFIVRRQLVNNRVPGSGLIRF